MHIRDGLMRKSLTGLAAAIFSLGLVFGATPLSAAKPTSLVRAPDPIEAKYISLGGASSFLDRPVGPEHSLPGGRYQDYQGGSIYWSPRTGAHEVHGAIRAKYRSSGGVNWIGYPVTDELAANYRAGARYSDFQGASLYWAPGLGVHITYRCPKYACYSGHPTVCSPRALRFRTSPNKKLSYLDQIVGAITTETKFARATGRKFGWRTSYCFVHNAVAYPVRRAQWSTDRFWTVDIQLRSFEVEGLRPTRTLYLRLEIRPDHHYAHGLMNQRCKRPLADLHGFHKGCHPPTAGTRLTFGGLIVEDHAHKFLEVHPDYEFRIG